MSGKKDGAVVSNDVELAKDSEGELRSFFGCS